MLARRLLHAGDLNNLWMARFLSISYHASHQNPNAISIGIIDYTKAHIKMQYPGRQPVENPWNSYENYLSEATPLACRTDLGLGSEKQAMKKWWRKPNQASKRIPEKRLNINCDVKELDE